MKILFDLTPVYDHLTGIERYNINISKEMILNHPDSSYILVFKNEIHEDFRDIVNYQNVRTIVIPESNKFIFIQWKLYKAIKNIDVDYYVFLSFTGPVMLKKHGIINAIHDLTCVDCSDTIPLKMKYYYRVTNKVAIKRSKIVLTVSEFSKKRICEHYNISEYNVPVIYDGLSDKFWELADNQKEIYTKYNLPQSYILSLSTIEPRKNLQLLIKAYDELIQEGIDLPDLVLAGRKGWKLEETIGDINKSTKEKIHFTGFIDDCDLPQVYYSSILFVFPSKYEGFGLPVIEAMSQGAIVICSDAASLPEVAGDAGIIFKSNDLESLKEKMLIGLTIDAEERKNRTRKGMDIARSFSWKKEAEKFYQILINNIKR